MSVDPQCVGAPNKVYVPVSSNSSNPLVLMVLDHLDASPELRHVFQLNGYRVIGTDNGQDAVANARLTDPDLLVVDMDVPLLYELVAARQIIKHAHMGALPVVIVTHEDVVDPAPMMEIGTSRNEYVTRLADYQQLQPLLDYLLPILPRTAEVQPARLPILSKGEPKARRGVLFRSAR